jgi:hypothetical protein
VGKNIIVIILTMLVVFNMMSLAQPSNLTDRELLIQLHSKIEFIEQSVKRIESNSANVNERINLLDKQVSKNEINIASFFNRLEDLVVRWNALLVLFAGFIITIFVWMWRRAYNGKNNKLAKTNK